MFLFKRKEEVQEPELTVIHNQPKGTVEMVKISRIIVPNDFRNHQPSASKKDKIKKRYYRIGHLDKPLTIIAEVNERKGDTKLILVDGYARYTFAKYYLRQEYVPVKYISYEEYFEMKEKEESEYRKYKETVQSE